VPGTSKKGVKRNNTTQTQKRKRKKGVYAKKGKKRAPRDLWQALLFTAVLIGVSALISMAVLGIKRGKVRQLSELATLSATESAALPEALSAALPAALPITEPETAMPELTISKPTTPEKPLPKTAAQEERSAQKPPPEKKSAAVSKPPQEKPAAPKESVVVNSSSKTKNTAEKAPAKKTDNREPSKPPAAKPTPQKPAAPPKLPPKPAHQGTLVFIIDDAGNNLKELEPFLRFPGPLTIAVLPGLPYSAEAARRIRAAGKEVFLHQPMEASGGQYPGPGAIYAGMSDAEILAILKQNIEEIGPVIGMNNHQGSQITADQQAMETVLTFCREQGICFLDSRTTAKTAVPAAARNLGIKIGERNIFIDNEQDRSSMSRYIENGLALASQKGSAVMIGHTWSPELAPLLAEYYQDVIAQGYTLATVSDFINRDTR
jgi:polysaccharide deacetylase 2 family uncharacterized protein YibQ